jgi:KEOPS complex subunit Cgi121
MCEIIGVRVVSGKLDPQKLLEQIQNFAKENSITVQIFDAQLIFGKDHLRSACEHAKRAFDQKNQISGSLEMEILLYAAGEYQIKNALGKLGVKPGANEIAIITVGELENIDGKLNAFCEKLKIDGLELSMDSSVLDGDLKTLKSFGITDEELNAVPKDRWLELVLEKVALVDIIK